MKILNNNITSDNLQKRGFLLKNKGRTSSAFVLSSSREAPFALANGQDNCVSSFLTHKKTRGVAMGYLLIVIAAFTVIGAGMLIVATANFRQLGMVTRLDRYFYAAESAVQIAAQDLRFDMHNMAEHEPIAFAELFDGLTADPINIDAAAYEFTNMLEARGWTSSAMRPVTNMVITSASMSNLVATTIETYYGPATRISFVLHGHASGRRVSVDFNFDLFDEMGEMGIHNPQLTNLRETSGFQHYN